jgi:hypothetical protein
VHLWLARCLLRCQSVFLICLFLSVIGFVSGFEYPNGAIRSGMVLNDVAIPLSLATKDEPVVLFASAAKTLDDANLLHLEEVSSIFCLRGDDKSSICVKKCVFDFKKKEIISLEETDLILDISNPRNVSRELRVDDSGTHKKRRQSSDSGSALDVLMGSGVDAHGYLFAQVKSFHKRSLPPKEETDVQFGIDSFFADRKMHEPILPESLSRLKLVQEACGSLVDFYKCWPLADGQKSGEMGCFSKNGGRLADLEKGIMINGPAVILSEPIVLNATEGLSLHRGISEDHEEMETHVLANNGVKAVLSGDGLDISIKCRSFKQVVERKAAQFEGGPVVMRRNHVTMVAGEEWQFVRIFDNHRVVLSPGKWQVVGILKPDDAGDHQ